MIDERFYALGRAYTLIYKDEVLDYTMWKGSDFYSKYCTLNVKSTKVFNASVTFKHMPLYNLVMIEGNKVKHTLDDLTKDLYGSRSL